MPIFEYRCSDCAHEFEFLRLASTESVRCPSCQSSHLEKLLSLPSLSSDQTKAKASRDIKARNRATRKDQAEAEVARIKAHSDD